ncbi:LacI family transcriptional regulator [Nocardioides mangrovicus]|uniref:LacI family transcriptional regulator n=1 Tax=Nocardioides mangrovicus TaxID=2478913 RepID=A0A3L8P7P0_9ACTN|nr:LacI family DNA-binding transcriptional regulator [Nocardioides mangrovicus]RLV50773.1 LacI family transcriptional regulator [Nocardioides mangrovicus]
MTTTPRRTPTLEDLAARAGVSRATASRVLRGQTNVSDEAREAVLAAAEELSYTPNQAARSLVTGRSNSLAFCVDESQERMFSDPFFFGMLRGAQGVVAGAGQQLVFTVTSREEEHRRFLAYAAAGHVDGVLLLSLHGRDRLPQELEAIGVPTVLSGRPLTGASLYYVDADNVGGGRLATEHLRRAGRRVVAHVAGPLDMCAGQDRLAGYREALGEDFEPELVESADWTVAGGEAATAELLRRRPDLDAVFAGSDLEALGVIRALEHAGRRVGTGADEVAVVGFDDVQAADQQRVPLTTVRQPIADLGATMTSRLLERLAGEDPPRSTVLPVELVVRRTA